jgi:NADPH-dependent 2,4-dienoyl-CoA reductase/sulfur reductase-like enzyme
MAGPGPHRRRFLAAASAAAATAALPRIAAPAPAAAEPHVVIVGGGFGGASAARELRRLDPGIRVTLVEREPSVITCPFSNTVLAGLQGLDRLTFTYDGLRRAGITVVQDIATAIDPQRRQVRLAGGGTLGYDRLVLSPGIRFSWGAIEGYDEAAAEIMPHAWKAGTQTLLLRRQLQAMPDGGLVVIAAPANPYRCPPGPYERACLIAHYLKRAKPRSKLMILDAKDSFSKQPLFEEAWRTLYPGLVEWVPASKSGRVVKVDAKTGVVATEFDEFRPAVANIIPPHTAGDIALSLSLDQGKGYCQVDGRTLESPVQPGIHLVGDAIIAGGMPKSGFSANVQGKVCAAAIAALLRGRPVADPVLLNTCYSLAAPSWGFNIAGAYRPAPPGGAGAFAEIEGSGGISPPGAAADIRAQEADFARSWYANVTAEMYG